ncbi:MAG TPA: hypothetical protein VK737_11335, partial [Opitutales bacterium]|nr:hypothetical protein [Opitutales bacterium]
ARFRLNQIVATPNALSSIPNGEIQMALSLHLSGDWGEVCAEDHAANERALVDGSRLFSAYRSKAGQKFWIITEADRAVTTILLPEDY